MDILLLAFAIPVATILLAIVLQKILKCPLLVAATFFAIFLIVTFAVFDVSFLVLAILYTILAYVTALLTRLICNLISRFNLGNNCNCVCGNSEETNNNLVRNVNGNLASGTWCLTTRNLARTGVTQITANTLTNNETTTTDNNTSEGESEPVIILNNTNDITNNVRTGRSGNGCNCNRR